MNVLRGKLADTRLQEFKINSYSELQFYHLKKELMELHEEVNSLPKLLLETDEELFNQLVTSKINLTWPLMLTIKNVQ